eukprot:scaffold175813_cov28-Prasinocladus_malaysianus.AAC.1
MTETKLCGLSGAHQNCKFRLRQVGQVGPIGGRHEVQCSSRGALREAHEAIHRAVLPKRGRDGVL